MRALIFGLLLILSAAPFAAPTVVLTASPTSGISPLNVTLTWSASAELTSCLANGGWSGVKGTSGTEVVSITTGKTFSLVCSSATENAVLSWTAPTQNTDNTPVPTTGPGSLGGYKIYKATSTESLAAASPIVVTKDVVTYTTPITAGTWYFGVKAYNVENVDSDMSGIASKTAVLPSVTATTSVTVNTQPLPPTLKAITTIAYTVVKKIDGFVMLPVGTIPAGQACKADQTVNGYYVVPRASVTWTGSVKPDVVVAQCAIS
jgi:hypothetical protein